MPFFVPPQYHEQLVVVEDHIRRAARSRNPIITRAVTDLADSGGKRLRPLFTLIGGQFGNVESPSLKEVAAAIELLHMATLVHDDIIDNAGTRRGTPTVRAVYGADVAVFTGDYLLTKALWLLARARVDDLHIDLANAMIDVCEEEVGQFSGRFQVPDMRCYLRRIRGKTAALFALAIVSGARQCRANAYVISNLGRYALDFGIAYQIEDDMLDYSADVDSLGKPVGNDIRSGVYTLPLIYALKDPRVGCDLSRAISERDSVDVSKVFALVRGTDALTKSREVRDSYLARALRRASRLPDCEAKQTLLDVQAQLFTSITSRYHTLAQNMV